MQVKTKLNNGDLGWSYAGKFLNVCSGLVTLPLILRILSEEEIAFNYVLATLMSIAALFDLGFSPQFSRNFAFIFGGAQEIVKIGIPASNSDSSINYQLLYQLITAAKLLYRIISLIVLILLLTVGTCYIYSFSEHFTLFDDCLPIWLFFVVSVVLDFYYRYFSTILLGKGQIKEVNQIDVLANIARILILCALLFWGMGLWAVVIGNFVRLLLIRSISYNYFFTSEIRLTFASFRNIKYDKWSILKTLWFNARKTAIVCVSTYTCAQLGFFFSSIYLSKSDVASYGLLNQILIILTSFSMNVCYSLTPIYSLLRAQNKYDSIQKNFYFSMGIFYVIQITISLIIIFAGPYCLSVIKSNAVLPGTMICVIGLLYKFLENQHVVCSCYLTTQNKIIDFESSIIIGIRNLLFFWGVLEFTDLGLKGVLLIQLFIPLCYPNWKWPYELCKEFRITYPQLVINSLFAIKDKLIIPRHE